MLYEVITASGQYAGPARKPEFPPRPVGRAGFREVAPGYRMANPLSRPDSGGVSGFTISDNDPGGDRGQLPLPRRPTVAQASSGGRDLHLGRAAPVAGARR